MRRTALLFVTLVAVVAGTACTKLQARMEIKKGNALYKEEAYKPALEQFQTGLKLDPGATFAWRSVGLTCMALFRPGNESPENLQYAEMAVDAFKKYLAENPDDEKVQEYLVNMFINADRYDEAIAFFKEHKANHPEDKRTDQTIALLLAKAGRLREALDWTNAHLAKEPRPEIYYTIGVGAWDKSYNDPMLDAANRAAVVDAGLDAMKRAVELKPGYFEAMAYFNLLYREKAKMETDPVRQQEWVQKANEWAIKSLAARKQAAKNAPAGTSS